MLNENNTIIRDTLNEIQSTSESVGIKNEETCIETVRKYICKVCDKEFKRASSLSSHKKAEHSMHIFKCPTCNYITRSADYLRKHISRIHNRSEMSACPYCNKTFSSKRSLDAHKGSEHENLSLPCRKCAYVAKRKINLQFHVQKVHEGIKYICEFCDKVCARKENLQKHVKNIHQQGQWHQ